jgi:AbiTii-like protein
VPLSSTLRKARVLASQLNSDELANWASRELDGYQSVDELPDYRVIRTGCVGDWTNGFFTVNNQGVRLGKIDNES